MRDFHATRNLALLLPWGESAHRQSAIHRDDMIKRGCKGGRITKREGRRSTNFRGTCSLRIYMHTMYTKRTSLIYI